MKTNTMKLLAQKYSLTDIQEVQIKNGVHVYEVKKNTSSYFIKYFEKVSDAFEIQCYKVLSKTDIPIVKHYEACEKEIVLENMNSDGKYRIGCEEDFSDTQVIKSVAKWFKQLHKLSNHDSKDFEFLEEEKIEFIKSDINLCKNKYNNDFFDLLLTKHTCLNDYLLKCKKIVTHGDFYYKNFFVKKEDREIIMFDYNYMTKTIRSEELNLIRRNLRSSSKKSEEIFIKEYGEYDEIEYEIYNIYHHMRCLISALSYDSPPNWALDSIASLNKGVLSINLKLIMAELENHD